MLVVVNIAQVVYFDLLSLSEKQIIQGIAGYRSEKMRRRSKTEMPFAEIIHVFGVFL
jgi:hypothetical protein